MRNAVALGVPNFHAVSRFSEVNFFAEHCSKHPWKMQLHKVLCIFIHSSDCRNFILLLYIIQNSPNKFFLIVNISKFCLLYRKKNEKRKILYLNINHVSMHVIYRRCRTCSDSNIFIDKHENVCIVKTAILWA